jgi:hypothetical protein
VVERTEIDGVPVFLAPKRGPNVTAGIVFRVGRADETLGTSGITHLVEHLALHRLGVTDYHYNGVVDTTTTQFVTQGAEGEVTTFLSGVVKALADLPLDRLATEKEVLRTEALGRKNGVNSLMPLWRHGTQGFGLVSYPEWGLARVSAGEASMWTRDRFCRENAALWIAGDRVPPGLVLSLPTGSRFPLPKPTSTVHRFPAYFNGPGNGVVLEALVPRGIASSLLAAVVQRMLLRTLRHDSGISYTVETDYHPRGDDWAVLTVFADTAPDKQAVLLGAFGDALKGLRARGIDSDDLDAVRRHGLDALDHPDAESIRVPGMAINELTGHPNLSLRAVRADLETIDAEAVNAVCTQLLEAALLQVPYGHRAEQLGFEPAPTGSTDRVSGRRYRSRGRDASTLIAGESGVTIVHDSSQATVHFDQCAARLDWPDGARHYIGLDGIIVQVEPTTHAIGTKELVGLRDGLPDQQIIPMPPRSPDQIPQRAKASPALRARRRARRRKIEAIIMPVVSALLTWWFITEANAWRPEDGTVAERMILGLMVLAGLAMIRTTILYGMRLTRRGW